MRQTYKTTSKLTFLSGFALMLSVGISITKALRMYVAMFEKDDPVFAGQLLKIAQSLETQASDPSSKKTAVARAFQQAPLVFEPRLVNQINAGDLAGNLAETFLQIAQQEEALIRRRAQLTSSLIYPFFILLFSLLLAFVILPNLVVPAISQLLPANQTPPLLTVWVLRVCLFLKNPLYIGPVIAVMALFFYSLRNNSEAHQWIQEKCQHLPLIGPGIQGYFLGNFFRVFHQMYKTGVKLDLAFRASAEASGSVQLDRQFQGMTLNKLSLKPLPEHFQEFPPLVSQLIQIGDDAGELNKMMAYLVDWYDGQLDDALAKTASLIEPVVILFLGLATLVIVLAIMLPLMQVLNTL